MALFLLKKVLKEGWAKSFIIAQICVSVVFGVLYYIQDNLIYYHTDYAKKMGLITRDFDMNEHNHRSLLYWLWLSIIIQSTVGNNLPFSTKGNHIYPIVNVLQLLSIFGVTAYYV